MREWEPTHGVSSVILNVAEWLSLNLLHRHEIGKNHDRPISEFSNFDEDAGKIGENHSQEALACL